MKTVNHIVIPRRSQSCKIIGITIAFNIYYVIGVNSANGVRDLNV